MEKNSWIDGLLEYLKATKKISELEADILSTIKTYKKDPFDRAEAEYIIAKNNYKYINLCATISFRLGSNSKPFKYRGYKAYTLLTNRNNGVDGTYRFRVL